MQNCIRSPISTRHQGYLHGWAIHVLYCFLARKHFRVGSRYQRRPNPTQPLSPTLTQNGSETDAKQDCAAFATREKIAGTSRPRIFETNFLPYTGRCLLTDCDTCSGVQHIAFLMLCYSTVCWFLANRCSRHEINVLTVLITAVIVVGVGFSRVTATRHHIWRSDVRAGDRCEQ